MQTNWVEFCIFLVKPCSTDSKFVDKCCMLNVKLNSIQLKLLNNNSNII